MIQIKVTFLGILCTLNTVEDTRPFIEKPSDLKLLTKKNVINILKGRQPQAKVYLTSRA